MREERIGVLITAAGMSRRMGEPKQLMKLGDRSFLQHIVSRMMAVQPMEIAVVTGYMAEQVRESLADYPAVFLHNENYGTTQMFDSVCMGLQHLQDRCDRIFFVPADVPLFAEDTLWQELSRTEDIVLPISDGRIGHPILIRSSCVAKILAYRGNRGLKGALDEFAREQVYYLALNDAGSIIDADTPEDAAKLYRLYDKKQSSAAIFGAGQTGTILRNLLPAEIDVQCYLDNDVKKQNTEVSGIPVYAPKAAVKMNVEKVYLAAVDPKRQGEQRRQLLQLGYRGRIISLSSLTENADLRLAALRQCAAMIKERNIEGDCAELGVFRGAFATEISRCFVERRLWLFDTFAGFADEDLKHEADLSRYPDFSMTDEKLVLSRLPYPDQAVIVKGRFPETVKEVPPETRFCFVSLDCDLSEPTREGLLWFWPRLNPGGIILINDYGSRQFPGVRKVTDMFCREHGQYLIPLADMHGSVILLKQGEETHG